MLQQKDFFPENWESVTWQIVSGTYVKGYKTSACLPPNSYLTWVIEHHRLFHRGAVLIENAVDEAGYPVWRLSIRQAEDAETLHAT